MPQSNALAIVARQAGANLLPDNAQWTNRMEIRSSTSTRLYTVAQRKSSGEWGCSCPAWLTRRRCKHLTAMLPLLEGAGVKVPQLAGH